MPLPIISGTPLMQGFTGTLSDDRTTITVDALYLANAAGDEILFHAVADYPVDADFDPTASSWVDAQNAGLLPYGYTL